MGLFSRGKSKQDAADARDATGLDLDLAEGEADLDTANGAIGDEVAPAEGEAGPFDRTTVDDDTDYLNLGAIWLRGQQGMELRLEINEQEQQITGVTAVIGESAVQLQAFAAPRTEGVWVDIRDEIAASITGSGGTAEIVAGPFGQELLTRMPQAGADGRTVFMPARFVGVDGPRWFLRAVVSGRAAIDPEAADAVHHVIRTAVIDRGDEAMPPREVLPLRLPETPETPEAPPLEQNDPANALDDEAETAEAGRPANLADFKPFERGPEITEVR
ncbi:hypothetical protein BA895_10205 [Humibacillus sp. DSM 29435]|nr:hypothetical protein BA895_10205 [Humibacillus sp. DSM 29435]